MEKPFGECLLGKCRIWHYNNTVDLRNVGCEDGRGMDAAQGVKEGGKANH